VRAAWATGVNFFGTTPTWNAFRSDDTNPAIRWPAPSNVCQVLPALFECTGTGPSWAASGSFNRVAAVLWSGLDEVAAVVTTCGMNGAEDHVCVAVTRNAGNSFQKTFILSIPDKNNNLTGGGGGFLDPDSLQATAAFFGERTNGNIGEVSLPMYVVWHHALSSVNKWYFARIVVGATGDLAETNEPRELPNIINGNNILAGNRVTMWGYNTDENERIAIAYSDRADAAAVEDCDPDPGGGAPTNIKWWAEQSDDLGRSWNCFTGIRQSGCLPNTTNGRTLITSDTAWKRCVGPVMAGGTNTSPNNDRPEVAMHITANSNSTEEWVRQMFYFAINKKHTSGSQQRIHVYRTGGTQALGSDTETSINQIWVQPNEANWIDSWAQAIHVHSRLTTLSTSFAAITVVWRSAHTASANPAGLQLHGVKFTNTDQSVPLSVTLFDVTPAPGGANEVVPFPFQAKLGQYTGLSGYQGCADARFGGCPGTPFWTWPNVGIVVGWEDARLTTRTVNDVYARGGIY